MDGDELDLVGVLGISSKWLEFKMVCAVGVEDGETLGVVVFGRSILVSHEWTRVVYTKMGLTINIGC